MGKLSKSLKEKIGKCQSYETDEFGLTDQEMKLFDRFYNINSKSGKISEGNKKIYFKCVKEKIWKDGESGESYESILKRVGEFRELKGWKKPLLQERLEKKGWYFVTNLDNVDCRDSNYIDELELKHPDFDFRTTRRAYDLGGQLIGSNEGSIGSGMRALYARKKSFEKKLESTNIAPLAQAFHKDRAKVEKIAEESSKAFSKIISEDSEGEEK